MHIHKLGQWRHEHNFFVHPEQNEKRTQKVMGLTAVTMVVEIVAGIAFGSMALLADGWHMGTHTAALAITAFAYVYTRRHANDPRYSFGTGKVGALGGFASAVGLAVVALLVLAESLERAASPVTIRFDEAIAVAVVGLAVNLASALILRDSHEHRPDDGRRHHHRHRDHNLRSAYLHVLADALTSVLAIVALTAGKHLGWLWVDPAMGVVGALVIARWSHGLLRETSDVLLDAEVSQVRREAIRSAIENDADTLVADLHVWRVGPRHFAAILSIVTHVPRPPEHYKDLLSGHPDLVHVTVEVHRCEGEPCVPCAV